MIRYALSWGGGTHFKDPERIGKFGFGLPNSSINQTKRVEVYSKVEDRGNWVCGVLDINEVPTHGLVKIPEPRSAELPKFVQEFLKRNKIKLNSGTIVVWVKPDRINPSTASTLAEHLRFDFRATYRGILDEFNIFVASEDTLEPLDPLFITPEASFYLPPNPENPMEGGAWCTFDKALVVKYWRDKRTGRQRLQLLNDEDELNAAEMEMKDPSDDIEDLRVGTMNVRVARFPVGFVDGKKKGTDAYRRFEYRKDRRGMSFLRGGREIDTVDVFPKSSKDEASGLGNWPLLQTYAYHWGVECSFGPDLDDVFGIGHDKQTVGPIEDFWRVLHEAKVDKALHAEQAYQRTERDKTNRKKSEDPTANDPAAQAAAQASKATGRKKGGSTKTEQESEETSTKVAEERARSEKTTVEEARKALEAEARSRPYDIGFFDAPGGVFMLPDLGNGLQVVAKINRSHGFFNFYSEIGAKGGTRPQNAVNLLLLGLAEAELMADTDEARLFLQDLREHGLNRFLTNSLKVLDSLLPEDEEERDSTS